MGFMGMFYLIVGREGIIFFIEILNNELIFDIL